MGIDLTQFGKWIGRVAWPFLKRILKPAANILLEQALAVVTDVAENYINATGEVKRKVARKEIRERLKKIGVEAATSDVNLAIERAYQRLKGAK